MSERRLKGKIILIVDDDEDIQSSIELAIRAEGAETVTANDGNEALALWHSADPDAIVLDVMLPKRSGFLGLEKLHEADEPPPVVMVTANQGKRHMEYAESLGVKAYLYKPVALQKLVDIVVKICHDEVESSNSDEDSADKE
ncbi:MAG: response regulator [Planctomycetota bacterium]|nr:response regulator [Planctomycetota bacterium]